ncbi:Uncharacterised protein [Vibrio cholerae]|nr:Uncharacterised protein [Vibrio cholerae]CSI62294.1 Uncharacterised protein [Vibrio cholerae]
MHSATAMCIFCLSLEYWFLHSLSKAALAKKVQTAIAYVWV